MLTLDDIRQLIAQGETITLELKKTTGELKDAMHSACAFLNSQGGWLIFGITPQSLRIVGETELEYHTTPHEVIISFPRPSYQVAENEGDDVKSSSHLPSHLPSQLPSQSLSQSLSQLPSQPLNWDKVAQIFLLMSQPRTLKELRAAISVRGVTYFRQNYIAPFVENDYFEMTIPDKPNSRLQKYRLTDKGRQLLTDISNNLQNNKQ